MSIRIGILGYGNLGRGVECAIRQNPDMELAAVFTRRNPEDVTILTKSAAVCSVADAADWKDKIDLKLILELYEVLICFQIRIGFRDRK